MALPLQELPRRLTATAATDRASAANLAPSGAVVESAEQLLSAYLQEAEANVTGYAWQIVPGELAGGRAVLEAEPSLQLAFICASLRRVVAKDDGRCGGCY